MNCSASQIWPMVLNLGGLLFVVFRMEKVTELISECYGEVVTLDLHLSYINTHHTLPDISNLLFHHIPSEFAYATVACTPVWFSLFLSVLGLTGPSIGLGLFIFFSLKQWRWSDCSDTASLHIIERGREVKHEGEKCGFLSTYDVWQRAALFTLLCPCLKMFIYSDMQMFDCP